MKKTHLYLPPHAIWYQTVGYLIASITVVNNKYMWQIFDRWTGYEIHRGNRGKLETAKREVFRVLDFVTILG